MSMIFSEASINAALDSIAVTEARLHSADPGVTGASELSTGRYQRQPATFAPAATGVRYLYQDLLFLVSPGHRVAFITFWNGGTWVSTSALTVVDFTNNAEILIEKLNCSITGIGA